MKDRLFTFIDYTTLNPTDFADKIGVSRASISSIKNERTQLTLSIIVKIKEIFPELNIDWLMFGKGIMINSASANNETADLSLDFTNNDATQNIFVDLQNERRRIDEEQETLYETMDKKTASVSAKEKSRGEHNHSSLNINNNIDTKRTIDKIIIFYSDDTYEEIK